MQVEGEFSGGEHFKKRQADATPHAAALIEGMRDFGYTLETAMADIIDNSITAGASRVEIIAEPLGESPWIAVVDDGKGMDEAELVEAMRPGSRNPLDEREGHDLGRFGLGLKSASFSQCRKLTVITCREGNKSAATWDLDEVAKTNVWRVDFEDDLADVPAADRLPDTGTIVCRFPRGSEPGFSSRSEPPLSYVSGVRLRSMHDCYPSFSAPRRRKGLGMSSSRSEGS